MYSVFSWRSARQVGVPTLLVLAMANAHAQQSSAAPADETPATLSTVVVTATGSAIDIQDAPASITVITREEIERQPVHDLGTLLRRVPGVTGGVGPEGDAAKIKLRGLPENYTLILVDGKRVGRSADTHYRPDLGRQDLNWITPDLIERIEVVRGPMSSLYGSDAMGGVINIITRKVATRWGGSVTANYTRPQDSDRGDAYQLGAVVSGPLTENLGLRLSATHSRDNPDEINNEAGASGGHRNDGMTGLVNWIVAPGHEVSLEGQVGVQKTLASNATNANGRPVAAGWGASELRRRSVTAGYQADWGFGQSNINFYHNKYTNEISNGTAESSDSVLEGTLNIPFTFGFAQALTVGGQWKRDELTNTDTIGTLPIDYGGGVVDGSTLSGRTWALFLEDEVFLRDDLTLTLGARLDHHDKFGNHVSPRAYLVYRPAPAWTIRGGVSRGFRAPTLKENTAGAATQSGGNGCRGLIPMGYVSGGCYMAGNANLQPETSTSSEIGVGYADNGWDAGLTYFHTDFRNKIDYQPLGFFNGYWWTRMENAQKARTRGLEGALTVPLMSNLTWHNTMTWMMEAKNLTTGADLLSTPKLSVYSSLSWQPTDRTYLDLAANYTGRQLGGGTMYAKAYTVFDLFGGYSANENVTLRVGVQNLFNKQPRTDGGTSYYIPGRRFFAGVTTRF